MNFWWNSSKNIFINFFRVSHMSYNVIEEISRLFTREAHKEKVANCNTWPSLLIRHERQSSIGMEKIEENWPHDSPFWLDVGIHVIQFVILSLWASLPFTYVDFILWIGVGILIKVPSMQPRTFGNPAIFNFIKFLLLEYYVFRL